MADSEHDVVIVGAAGVASCYTPHRSRPVLQMMRRRPASMADGEHNVMIVDAEGVAPCCMLHRGRPVLQITRRLHRTHG